MLVPWRVYKYTRQCISDQRITHIFTSSVAKLFAFQGGVSLFIQVCLDKII